jgi:hopene-associated glycosyltransferase HpnB
MTFAVALLAVATWIYLLTMRGGFWRGRERDDRAGLMVDAATAASTERHAQWPKVVAIMPARNESNFIGATVRALLAQEYAGTLTLIVVDDHSTDGTGAIAEDAANALLASDRLTVLSAPDLPQGWTGKLWAMHAGATHADAMDAAPDYVLFTDADIEYAPGTVAALVKHAEREGLVLASLMAKLHCVSVAERMLIPAFIFYFQMLYPFAWVNDRTRSTAAAAGGCMLVRRKALAASGGMSAIRGALIDDCALARRLKAQGPIWLALTNRAKSLRPSATLADMRRMISRSAYAQLRYSPWVLSGAAAAMMLTYLTPPLLALAATGVAQWAGAAAWLMMALAVQPTLRGYGVSRAWGLVFPLIAGIYLVFTVDSAWQHWRGKGGLWKGRTYVPASDRR